MKQEESIRIDVEAAIRSKNPNVLKVMPRFVLNYIKKIVHQEEFNLFLEKSNKEIGLGFANAALVNFQIQVRSYGLENLPLRGGFIAVCNHPLGGIDGIAVMHEIGKHRPDMKAFVNDLLMNLKSINHLLIPINKHAKNSMENIRLIDKVYASDECKIIFPAGLVSRKQKGIIKDLDWQKSFITKAVKYQKEIVPIHIQASNSAFFYNLSYWRKKLGIKVNIEMLYLVDEVYKQKGKEIVIRVGSPISYNTFTKEKSDREWAHWMREHVYAIGRIK